MGIEDLRREIDEIDREIIKCLARRLSIVREIGRLKAREGRLASDDERELYVKSYWRQMATTYGVPIELAEELSESIIRYSKYVQLRDVLGFDVKTITFVGYGRMGRLLALYAVRAGHRVIITGRSFEKAERVARDVGGMFLDIGEAIRSGDFIVLALSSNAFVDGYIDEITSLFRGKIVMDILSSKANVFRYMEDLSIRNGFSYISVHPLFGPQTTPIGEKIAIIPSKTGIEHVDDICMLWRSMGLEPVVVDVDVHEKSMAIVQVLTHLYLLALSQSVDEISREFNVNPYRLSTPTFREVMNIVRRLNSIMDVVIEIQRSNPFSDVVRSRALSTLENIVRRLRYGDGNDIHSKGKQ